MPVMGNPGRFLLASTVLHFEGLPVRHDQSTTYILFSFKRETYTTGTRCSLQVELEGQVRLWSHRGLKSEHFVWKVERLSLYLS